MITYGITVCNEEQELRNLLDCLFEHMDDDDQIIILQDITNPHEGVSNLIEEVKNAVLHLTARLDGDFSAFKNNLVARATCDYLFQIDADEIPSESLLQNLKQQLQKSEKVDCFCVPRINIVHGITDEHITKWNWKQNEDGYVNFPDFQMRIFKLKTKRNIHWVNKVHEVLAGYQTFMNLPDEDYRFCLIHEKNIKRQEAQNDFYDDLM
ncbi:glycosyltransferase family 2 protein [Sphingobacterium gobiense]|nr:glycosyltransferase family A protein [Sphingobacterium gobiense]